MSVSHRAKYEGPANGTPKWNPAVISYTCAWRGVHTRCEKDPDPADFKNTYVWKMSTPQVHVILICSRQTVAACDQCHQGSGPAACHPGKVCAGGSSAERGQGERRQTLEPTTFPSGPCHLRVDLQAHGVWTHSHTKQKEKCTGEGTCCYLFSLDFIQVWKGLSCRLGGKTWK